MEIFGKIICALPIRSGVSAKSGKPWQSASYVLETQDQYPKRMAFDVFGQDNIAKFNIQVGESLTVSFDIDAHEYQGRWFNAVRAWSVFHGAPQPVVTPQPSVLPPVGAPGSALGIPTPRPPQQPPLHRQEAPTDCPFDLINNSFLRSFDVCIVHVSKGS